VDFFAFVYGENIEDIVLQEHLDLNSEEDLIPINIENIEIKDPVEIDVTQENGANDGSNGDSCSSGVVSDMEDLYPDQLKQPLDKTKQVYSICFFSKPCD